jgi:hypothetical protein
MSADNTIFVGKCADGIIVKEIGAAEDLYYDDDSKEYTDSLVLKQVQEKFNGAERFNTFTEAYKYAVTIMEDHDVEYGTKTIDMQQFNVSDILN